MKVLGLEVKEAQIAVCIERMKAGPFTAGELIVTATGTGFEFPMRLADRLITREKKYGNIRLSQRKWTWIANEPSTNEVIEGCGDGDALPLSVKDAYENGVCPDCGEEIPDEAVQGQACSNCGHAFYCASVAEA